jgi:aminodeoxychorismate lyase
MIVFLNGKFVPAEKAFVSIFDRGFLYGDGLYEGLLVTGGIPFRWEQHMERLRRGVEFLKLTIPFSHEELRKASMRLIQRNKMPECMLRLSFSRGITERGYSPKNARNPAVTITLHPAPVVNKLTQWRVIISSCRLPTNDPLTGFKTASKITQVLARAEADEAGAQEAILLNTKGRVAEGTTCNVFWVKNKIVHTPPLPDGALPGVTRAAVMELCVKLNIPCRERKAMPAELRRADAAFLTMTSMGVVEITSLDNQRIPRSPLVKKLWTEYRSLLKAGK